MPYVTGKSMAVEESAGRCAHLQVLGMLRNGDTQEPLHLPAVIHSRALSLRNVCFIGVPVYRVVETACPERPRCTLCSFCSSGGRKCMDSLPACAAPGSG